MPKPKHQQLPSPPPRQKNLQNRSNASVMENVANSDLKSQEEDMDTNNVSNQVMEIINSDSKPIRLGMGYDARHNSLVPGYKIGSDNAIVSPFYRTEYEMSSEDSIEKKRSKWGVSGSFSLDFKKFGASGSGGYSKESRDDTNKIHTSIDLSTPTVLKELDLSALSSEIQSSELVKQGLATHVVTAIQYGVDASFVFSQTIDDTMDKQTAHGKLKANLKASLNIEVEGKGSWNEETSKKLEAIEIKFSGDFSHDLGKMPMTTSETLDVIRNFPEMLKRNESVGVPKVFWIYPLRKIAPNVRVPEITNRVSDTVRSAMEDVLENVNAFSMRIHLAKSLIAPHPILKLQMSFLSRFQISFHEVITSGISGLHNKVHGLFLESKQEEGDVIGSIMQQKGVVQDWERKLDGIEKVHKVIVGLISALSKDERMHVVTPNEDGDFELLVLLNDDVEVLMLQFPQIDSSKEVDFKGDILDFSALTRAYKAFTVEAQKNLPNVVYTIAAEMGDCEEDTAAIKGTFITYKSGERV